MHFVAWNEQLPHVCTHVCRIIRIPASLHDDVTVHHATWQYHYHMGAGSVVMFPCLNLPPHSPVPDHYTPFHAHWRYPLPGPG